MTFKIKGLDELQAKLDQIRRKAEDVDGTSVPVSEIFTDEFLRDCSEFNSFSDLLANAGHKPSSAEELDEILGEEFDIYINEVTKFENWEQFKEAALGEFAKKTFSL